MGVPMSEVRRMPWGRLVMMLQARAQSYRDEEDTGPREATWEEVKAWL